MEAKGKIIFSSVAITFQFCLECVFMLGKFMEIVLMQTLTGSFSTLSSTFSATFCSLALVCVVRAIQKHLNKVFRISHMARAEWQRESSFHGDVKKSFMVMYMRWKLAVGAREENAVDVKREMRCGKNSEHLTITTVTFP